MRKAVLSSQIALKRAAVLSNAYQPCYKNSIENDISKRKNGYVVCFLILSSFEISHLIMRKAVLSSQIALKRAVVLSNAYQPFFKNSIENDISKRKNGYV
ncbi:hypothetical protein TNCV_3736391 [Trichonephila clavipes]|nr:hypothetical protein TNCV_3736391 [Trichonephila clavipes]